MSVTKHFILASIIFFAQQAFSQVIENTINLYGTNFPQEKIHIHFDKAAYLPGETIWLKAYLLEEYSLSNRSTNFYASLYDENGNLVQQLICPIFSGTAAGSFQIPAGIKSKQLICRAYTTWMLNFDSSFLYTKTLRLIHDKDTVNTLQKTNTVSLQFFPEGGDIIEGAKNTIAFKANYNNGLPFGIDGLLKKQETGEVVQIVRSVHDGMGRFDLDIEPDEKYYLEWTDNKGAARQSFLPNAKPTGVSLKMIQAKKNIVFNIVNKLPEDSLHILMYLYQKVFYKTDIAVSSSEPYTATVPVSGLPSGVMQLTVFDAAWQPVAERVAFINNNNYSPGVTINSIETSTKKRGKNRIEIAVADTVFANMSLSITDAEMNGEPGGSTIISDLLLSGNVKGYINDPGYYFTNNTDITLKNNLDLVMLTHGWRHYKWDDMIAAKMPVLNYQPDNYLGIYGQLSKAALPKLDTTEQVTLIVNAKNNSKQFYFSKPDTSGLVKQTGVIFYDTAKLQYRLAKNKTLRDQLVFSNSNFTHNQSTVLDNFNSYLQPDVAGDLRPGSSSLLLKYYGINKIGDGINNYQTLQTVKVESSQKNNWRNTLDKMDESYATGLFRAGASAETFDVMHDPIASSKLDILNYIGYMSHIVSLDNTLFWGKRLKVNSGADTAVLKGLIIEPWLFIDEHRVETLDLETLPIDDVAYIKILPKYIGERDAKDRVLPAVSIYLKKGNDLIDKHGPSSPGQSIKIAGYSPVKEFYSPDYSQTNTGGTDSRVTLFWEPYILTNAETRKVPVTFYNNDFTKKIKLVLEGINDEGKLIHVEKIIE